MNKREIKSVSRAIAAVERDLEVLKDLTRKPPKGMKRTFSDSEGEIILKKLDRAIQYVESASDAEDDVLALIDLRVAGIAANAALSTVLAEYSEFNNEEMRFAAVSRADGVWEQYREEVRQAHDKFVAVVGLVTAVVQKIPALA